MGAVLAMECERARSRVSLGLDGELSEVEQAMLRAHVGRCAACAAFERDIDTVERLKPVAKNFGCTLAQLAIALVLANADVSVAIPGAKNRQQLESNVATGELPQIGRAHV